MPLGVPVIEVGRQATKTLSCDVLSKSSLSGISRKKFADAVLGKVMVGKLLKLVLVTSCVGRVVPLPEALLLLPDWSDHKSTNPPELDIPASPLNQSTFSGCPLAPVALPTPPGPV